MSSRYPTDVGSPGLFPVMIVGSLPVSCRRLRLPLIFSSVAYCGFLTAGAKTFIGIVHFKEDVAFYLGLFSDPTVVVYIEAAFTLAPHSGLGAFRVPFSATHFVHARHFLSYLCVEPLMQLRVSNPGPKIVLGLRPSLAYPVLVIRWLQKS